MNKKPAPKTMKPEAKATRKPVAKAVKPVAKKAVAKKPVTKAASKKVAVRKPLTKVASKKVAVKKPVAKVSPGKVAARKLGSTKVAGESIENLIEQRDIDLKSMDDALGIRYDSTKDHNLIPGKFDMIIPPGTPRKLIVTMAKEFNLEVAQRNDYYVPIGISDIQRELLVFRGDRKTIEKATKEFSKRLKAWAK
jgi:hypothetical protein